MRVGDVSLGSVRFQTKLHRSSPLTLDNRSCIVLINRHTKYLEMSLQQRGSIERFQAINIFMDEPLLYYRFLKKNLNIIIYYIHIYIFPSNMKF